MCSRQQIVLLRPIPQHQYLSIWDHAQLIPNSQPRVMVPKDHAVQLAYDALFKHWGVRLRAAKPDVTAIQDDPKEVKQEQKDFERALRGDECDEHDSDEVIVIDDPYFDAMFLVESQGAVQKGENSIVAIEGKTHKDIPVNLEDHDEVTCVSASSNCTLAAINLRIEQIQSHSLDTQISECFKTMGYSQTFFCSTKKSFRTPY